MLVLFITDGKDGRRRRLVIKPYNKIPVIIYIEEEDDECLEKEATILNENAKKIVNQECKKRYHTVYFAVGFVY